MSKLIYCVRACVCNVSVEESGVKAHVLCACMCVCNVSVEESGVKAHVLCALMHYCVRACVCNVSVEESGVKAHVLFFFCFCFLIQFNVPFKIISLIETCQWVGGAKRESPGKPPDTPASRTWLVSHVASAGLEPTPATAVR